MVSDTQEVFWMMQCQHKEVVYVSEPTKHHGRSLAEIRENPPSYKELVTLRIARDSLPKLEEQASPENSTKEFRIVRPDGAFAGSGLRAHRPATLVDLPHGSSESRRYYLAQTC